MEEKIGNGISSQKMPYVLEMGKSAMRPSCKYV